MSKNIAYIDGANLHKGTEDLGWKLDYLKFRVWLKDKYLVEIAKIFMGKITEHEDIYKNLTNAGFVIVFKKIIRNKYGLIKGNCDSELIVTAMSDHYENHCKKAIIVSSDGDFSILAEFLRNKNSLKIIISPRNSCSLLLKKLNVPIIYLDTQRELLEFIPKNEKTLDGDTTP